MESDLLTTDDILEICRNLYRRLEDTIPATDYTFIPVLAPITEVVDGKEGFRLNDCAMLYMEPLLFKDMPWSFSLWLYPFQEMDLIKALHKHITCIDECDLKKDITSKALLPPFRWTLCTIVYDTMNITICVDNFVNQKYILSPLGKCFFKLTERTLPVFNVILSDLKEYDEILTEEDIIRIYNKF